MAQQLVNTSISKSCIEYSVTVFAERYMDEEMSALSVAEMRSHGGFRVGTGWH